MDESDARGGLWKGGGGGQWAMAEENDEITGFTRSIMSREREVRVFFSREREGEREAVRGK